MNDTKLEEMASCLNDLNSLQRLFIELNFEFVDLPVHTKNWSPNVKKLISESRVIAQKDDFKIYYIRTKAISVRGWKDIASKIISENSGLCLVCTHDSDGYRWVFSSLSKNHSPSFSETRHIPIELQPNNRVSKPFLEFLKKIKVNESSSAVSILKNISRAFDEFSLKIHDELTVNVFDALKTISEGIISNKKNKLAITNESLEKIREPVFILLYRIIFILYAEDRGIFQIDHPVYFKEFSLKWIKQNWILDSTNTTKLREYQVQNRLKKLFQLIEKGSEDLGYSKNFVMRSYYGRLFDRKINSDLEKWFIPNSFFLNTLQLLTSTVDKKGNRFFLDYAALETRHLGAIYEHLLEYHLTEKNGKIVDLPDPKQRKSTGSYYTPQYIVDYMIENAIGPIIDDIIKNTKDKSEQIDKILDLNVLDPAMGSGHFLVGATNYITKRICEIESENEIITQQALVERKRDVVRRCIYGVDINPLAVDLASVSLWLETLSSERPLSFLSAHLKTGNSLIGSSIDNILEKQTTLLESPKSRTRFKDAVRNFIMLEKLEDDTASAVKTKIDKYQKLQSQGSIYYDLKFLLDAKLAKSFKVDVPPVGDYVQKIGEKSLELY